MSPKQPNDREPSLNMPLDEATMEKLRTLGKELVTSENARTRFLESPEKYFIRAGLPAIELGETELKAVELLSDPDFQASLIAKDYNGIRNSLYRRFGEELGQLPVFGVFDLDFDVEVEVEVVFIAVAVAALIFAAKETLPVATPEQLMERRRILSRALERLAVTAPVEARDDVLLRRRS
jgi:hypothetical protein